LESQVGLLLGQFKKQPQSRHPEGPVLGNRSRRADAVEICGDNIVTELSIQQVPSCAAGLHPHVLSATYAGRTFTGLFCVNAKGFGTYTQGIPTGFGWVTVVTDTTAIAALGKNLFLAGSTNGAKSSFVELAPVPIKRGTFTLS